MLPPTHKLLNVTGAVVVVTLARPEVEQAAILGVGIVAPYMLPDIDMKIRGLPHRGPATHSLLSCLIVAALVGLLFANAPVYDDWLGFRYESVDGAADAVRFLDAHATLIAIAVGGGILLHLLGDSITRMGIPFFWPLVRDDVHLLPKGARLRVGSWVEPCLYAAIAAALAWFVVTHAT